MIKPFMCQCLTSGIIKLKRRHVRVCVSLCVWVCMCMCVHVWKHLCLATGKTKWFFVTYVSAHVHCIDDKEIKSVQYSIKYIVISSNTYLLSQVLQYTNDCQLLLLLCVNIHESSCFPMYAQDLYILHNEGYSPSGKQSKSIIMIIQ